MLKRCREGRHFWLWPWQEYQRCALCGKLRSLGVGEHSISMSPAGIGDVIRWSATKDAVALGDIGMDKATGIPSAFVDAAARNVMMENVLTNQVVWNDLKIPLGGLYFNGTGSDPAYITFKTGLTIRAFNIGEELQFTTQIPHDYKEDTDLHLHLHWTPHTRGVTENGNTVNWRVDLAVKEVGGVFPSETTYDLTATCDGVNDKHIKQEATANVSGTGLKISSMLVGKVYRLTGDSWSTNTPAENLPGLLEVDLHYQINSLGSRQETVK